MARAVEARARRRSRRCRSGRIRSAALSAPDRRRAARAPRRRRRRSARRCRSAIARSSALASLCSRIAIKRPPLLDEAAIAGGIGASKPSATTSAPEAELGAHRRQRGRLDERSVGVDDQNVVVAALKAIARGQNRIGGAPALALDRILSPPAQLSALRRQRRRRPVRRRQRRRPSRPWAPKRAREPASSGPRSHAELSGAPIACAPPRRRRAQSSGSGEHWSSWDVCSLLEGRPRRRHGCSDLDLKDTPTPLSPLPGAVSSRDLSPHQRHFASTTKSVSLRRKKRYTTEPPRTERAELQRVFLRLAG